MRKHPTGSSAQIAVLIAVFGIIISGFVTHWFVVRGTEFLAQGSEQSAFDILAYGLTLTSALVGGWLLYRRVQAADKSLELAHSAENLINFRTGIELITKESATAQQAALALIFNAAARDKNVLGTQSISIFMAKCDEICARDRVAFDFILSGNQPTAEANWTKPAGVKLPERFKLWPHSEVFFDDALSAANEAIALMKLKQQALSINSAYFGFGYTHGRPGLQLSFRDAYMVEHQFIRTNFRTVIGSARGAIVFDKCIFAPQAKMSFSFLDKKCPNPTLINKKTSITFVNCVAKEGQNPTMNDQELPLDKFEEIRIEWSNNEKRWNQVN